MTGILNRQKIEQGKAQRDCNRLKVVFFRYLFTSVLPKRNIRVQEGRCQEADSVWMNNFSAKTVLLNVKRSTGNLNVI